MQCLALATGAAFLGADTQAGVYWNIQQTGLGGDMLGLVIQGEIGQADIPVVEEAITASAHLPTRVAILSSSGGSVHAAMTLGGLLREHSFDTVVPAGHSCVSACVFLLGAGIRKTVEGQVGIHRPYFAAGSSETVGQAILNLKKQTAAFFQKMNIPSRLAEDMFSIDPAEVKMLTTDELSAYRLNSKDFAAQEADALRTMENYGLSRQEYEIFQKDLDYSCRVLIGRPQRMKACVIAVADKYGIQLGSTGR